MKRTLLISMALLALSYAACLNVTHNAVILVDNDVLKIYPKLKVGSVLRNDVLVDYVNKYIKDFNGWLPKALVKVDQSKVPLCKLNHLKVYRNCTGVPYCLVPISQVPIFVYHGNYMELLNETFKGNIRGMGNPNSRLWIVELLDPFCPYCALFYSRGGGTYLEQLVKSGKVYLIVVMVAFHTNAKGYSQSLELAYVQQTYANNNQTSKFYELEKEIIRNLRGLYEGKVKLVNVIDVMKGPISMSRESKERGKEILSELSKWNQMQLEKANKLFPAIATPATVFVDTKTGRAIAIMGAQTANNIINLLKLLGMPVPK